MKRTALMLLASLLLAGCPKYEGAAPELDAGTGGSGGGSGGGGGEACSDDFFVERVEPKLAFCRNCHVPGGIGDKDGGNRFLLSAAGADDLSALHASWEAMDGNAGGASEILKMASGTASRSHSGGAPWPVGGVAYADVQTMLLGFDNPAQCVEVPDDPPIVSELPLLGSKHAAHRWQTFCEGDGTEANPAQPDSALLPPDPRSLVVPGTNENLAVHFNGWWEDCHVNLPAEQGAPKTCGQFRARRERGRDFLLNELPDGATAASSFNNSWQKWGLAERPENFDQLYTLRYGLNHAPFHNPYPLPGEDPKTTNGGSGRLPLGLRQNRNADGSWAGTIGNAACFACHGGQIGDPAMGDEVLIGIENLGLGNNNYDTPMSGRDSSPFAGSQFSAFTPGLSIESLFNIGIKQRGQNNAVGAFELLVTLLDLDSLGFNPNPTKNAVGESGAQDSEHPLAHTQDTPPWWNMGSRPRKFFDAGVSNDSTRIIMAAGGLGEIISQNGDPYRLRIEEYDQDLEAFFLSLRSPKYPGEIDTALAEQGAILFHNKDLWAEDLANPVAAPTGGNGSCASCHGAYSPRYVNDPAYLADPVLEGIASNIATLDVIGTDRARSDMLTPTLRRRWDATFWGYNDGMPGWVSPEDKDFFSENADDAYPLASDLGVPEGTPGTRPIGACGWQKEIIGYQAPPLYGVWATGPYLHNGSVPTVEALLDPSKRHAIWQRRIQTLNGVTGFDQSLAAFDFEALGWKHVALTCEEMPGSPAYNCNPADPEGQSAAQIVTNGLAGLGWAGIAASDGDPSENAVDKRLVYDTRTLGNDNGGHEFTRVLTQAERKAIIEYLKTL